MVYHGLPGTGKTTTLISRMLDEINNGVLLDEIVVTTFRKNLAIDFKSKAKSMLGLENDPRMISTTHSICFDLLNLSKDMVIGPEDVNKVCREIGIPYVPYINRDDNVFSMPDDLPLGNLLQSLRSYCIHNLLDPVEDWKRAYILLSLHRSRLSDYKVRIWNKAYERYKEENCKYDFDDMIKICVEDKISPCAEVLIEDEFQDKTPLQVELYRLWSGDASRVYIGGDPFQCIYSFFGTDPTFFNEEAERSNRVIVLPKSYRFGRDLWNVARRVLSIGGYDVPEIEVAGNTQVKVLRPSSFISSLWNHMYDDVFILCRTNYIADIIIGKMLDGYGIPYVSRSKGGLSGKLGSLYNAIVKVRRVLSNISGMSIPNFKLTPDESEALIDALPASCFITTKKSIKTAGKGIETVISDKFRKIVMSSNPFKYCLLSFFGSGVSAQDNRHKVERIWKNVGEILINNVNIEISTIHGSKGRERDYVYFIDSTSPVIQQYIHRPEVASEEHRVGFVGMTRARKGLYIVRGIGDPMLPYGIRCS